MSSQIKVQSPSCILHLHFPPLFVWSQIKAPSCSLHLHSPPPCPHPTKIVKVVHRLCYIFDMHTCGSRGMSKTGETKSAGDKCIALPQTAKALEQRLESFEILILCDCGVHCQVFSFSVRLASIVRRSKGAQTCHSVADGCDAAVFGWQRVKGQKSLRPLLV